MCVCEETDAVTVYSLKCYEKLLNRFDACHFRLVFILDLVIDLWMLSLCVACWIVVDY